MQGAEPARHINAELAVQIDIQKNDIKPPRFFNVVDQVRAVLILENFIADSLFGKIEGQKTGNNFSI